MTRPSGRLQQWFQQRRKPEYYSPDSNNHPSSNILLLDGGVSTYLESEGFVFSHRSLWSSSLLLTNHDAIRQCHEAFYRAGSDIVSSVTYQCHYKCCEEQEEENTTQDCILTEHDVDQMLRDGIRLARQARYNVQPECHRDLFIAASIGCYGSALADGSEYRGNYGLMEEELKHFHKRKLQILIEEAPDVLAFETIPEVVECSAIISLLKELHCSTIPVWISLACRDAHHLNSGSTVRDALDVIHTSDPDAAIVKGVGVNCCSYDIVIELARTLTRHMIQCRYQRTLVFYPNSGELWDAANASWIQGTYSPTEFANNIQSTIDAVRSEWKVGIQNGLVCGPPPLMIVGGCCRTSTDTIAAIRSQQK